MPTEVGKQFEVLWESSDSPPDVLSGLELAGELTKEEAEVGGRRVRSGLPSIRH